MGIGWSQIVHFCGDAKVMCMIFGHEMHDELICPVKVARFVLQRAGRFDLAEVVSSVIDDFCIRNLRCQRGMVAISQSVECPRQDPNACQNIGQGREFLRRMTAPAL